MADHRTELGRLLIVAPSAELAKAYVAEHHPELLYEVSRWRWVGRTPDLYGARRSRDRVVLLAGVEDLPDWPRIRASLTVLRLPDVSGYVGGLRR